MNTVRPPSDGTEMARGRPAPPPSITSPSFGPSSIRTLSLHPSSRRRARASIPARAHTLRKAHGLGYGAAASPGDRARVRKATAVGHGTHHLHGFHSWIETDRGALKFVTLEPHAGTRNGLPPPAPIRCPKSPTPRPHSAAPLRCPTPHSPRAFRSAVSVPSLRPGAPMRTVLGRRPCGG